MANGDPTSYGARTCRCAQHGPILGAVTFSGCVLETQADAEAEADRLFRLFARPLKKASPEMVEHVRRAVDDYVSSLGEVEDDAATVVELVQRGDSWHISIRAGELYCENAEPSWEAAVACVARILGEPSIGIQPVLPPDSVWQSVDSCAEVPAFRRELGAELSDFDHGWQQGHDNARAELLASLPPCRIDDPEALAKLTPAKVRAYLKDKGWTTSRFSVGEPWFESPPRANWCKFLLQPGNHSRADTLAAISEHESRSAAAVYLDILAAEPGD